MQLFGLVNTLLKTAPETMRRNLAIQRFAVVPLSTNSGLIGWVPHSDTLHTLIRDHREKKKIMLNIEHKIMLRVSDGVCLRLWGSREDGTLGEILDEGVLGEVCRRTV